MTFAFSLNEEDYHGPFDTIEEALGEANDRLNVDFEVGETHSVWVGTVVTVPDAMRKDTWLADAIVEDLENRYIDEFPADEDLISLTKEDKEALKETVIKFLEQRAKFTYFSVDEPREMRVTIE